MGALSRAADRLWDVSRNDATTTDADHLAWSQALEAYRAVAIDYALCDIEAELEAFKVLIEPMSPELVIFFAYLSGLLHSVRKP